MKRIYVLFTALCVCCALAAQDIKELLILHTNDTHSRVEPIPITDPNPEFAGKAGFVRRVTLIKEIRKQDKDLLLFDCGDFSQGSPFYNMFGGEVEVKLMNEMGYDAGTIGNHEFDLVWIIWHVFLKWRIFLLFVLIMVYRELFWRGLSNRMLFWNVRG